MFLLAIPGPRGLLSLSYSHTAKFEHVLYDANWLDTVQSVSTWFRNPQGSVEPSLRSGFYIEILHRALQSSNSRIQKLPKQCLCVSSEQTGQGIFMTQRQTAMQQCTNAILLLSAHRCHWNIFIQTSSLVQQITNYPTKIIMLWKPL